MIRQALLLCPIFFSNKALKLKSILLVTLPCLFLWFVPPPEGLNIQAWHLFIIFIGTIVSIITKPLPMGALAVIALSICTATNTLTIQQALTSFSSKTVWLVVIAFLLAKGFSKTGLGSRLAYWFIFLFGRTTLGLSYGLVLTELILAPFIPSNTARGAGIIFPIVNSLNLEFDSLPDKNTERKIGAYLITICFHANIITSAMFLTAMVANPIIASFAQELGVNITWGSWAKAAIVPGLISLVILPLLVLYFYPPQILQSPTARKYAQEELKKMGALTRGEWIMVGTFLLLLTLWIFGHQLHIDATSAAFCGLSILLLSDVLNWEDIVSEKNAWNTFIWLATLLMMTFFLSKFGMMTWFSHRIHYMVADFSWVKAFIVLSLVYFYSHYLFASLTAHVTSMYSTFAVVALLTGAPSQLVIFVLAFLSILCASLTHYGTGTAPVYFGSNYLSVKVWWKLGAMIGIVNLLIWSLFGGLWWKLIGLW